MRKNKELDGRVMLPWMVTTCRKCGSPADTQCVTRLGFPSSSSHRERIASFAAVHYPDERQLTLFSVTP